MREVENRKISSFDENASSDLITENEGLDYIVSPLATCFVSILGIGPSLKIAAFLSNYIINSNNITHYDDIISIRIGAHAIIMGGLISINFLNGYKNLDTWRKWLIE